MTKRTLLVLIPLALFAVLFAFFLRGLDLNPREVPSPLIGKPAPAFRLPQLADPGASFGPEDMRDRVWLFNVWASWCGSCRQEHPLLVELARAGTVPIVGLDYKDEPQAGMAWLADGGDPYTLSAMDRDGRVGIDYGVYGVPETYVIDRAGVIRHKHTGPITREVLDKVILPMVKELSR
jgi:cytochrome c biogenesis protein CcmG/thiol:disulfide interchange protein DsbE